MLCWLFQGSRENRTLLPEPLLSGCRIWVIPGAAIDDACSVINGSEDPAEDGNLISWFARSVSLPQKIGLQNHERAVHKHTETLEVTRNPGR